MPGISIIIPVYNGEKYLAECLDSVCRQTFADWEAICVDDGSEDSSGAILRRYGKNDKRIIYVKQEQQGAAAARNIGLSMARGEYVMFLDSDDCYLDDRALEKLYAAVKEKAAEVAAGRMKRISYGRLVDFEMFAGIKEVPQEGRWVHFEDYQEDYHYQVYIFQRQFLERYGIVFPLYKRYEDPPFLLQVLLETEKILMLPWEFYGYRWGEHRQSPHNISDVLRGISDNLKIAVRYGYDRLQRKLIGRLNEDFRQEILGAPVREILQALLRIDVWNVQGNAYVPIQVIPVLQQRLSGEMAMLPAEKEYVFPWHLFHRGEKVAIYGAGNIGRRFYHQAREQSYIRVAGLFDKNLDNLPQGLSAQAAGALKGADFDAVLIAVENGSVAEDIRSELMKMGIDRERIFWAGDLYTKNEFLRKVLFPLLDINFAKVL